MELEVTSNAAVYYHKDGDILGHLFVIANDNRLYKRVLVSSGWSGWESLGGTITSDPAVAVNDDSTLEAFVKWNNNQLYHIWQTSPHGSWSGWEPLGGTIAGNNIAVVKNAFHGLEAFVKWNNNQLYHIWQSKQHGNWSGWESLGGTITSDPAVAVNDDSTLEAFVKWNNNQLYHIWQIAPHGSWSGWEPLGGTIAGNNIAVAKNGFHGLETFVRGTDNALYHIWQDKQHGNWSSWDRLGGTLSSDPVAITNDDGALEVFVKWNNNQLYHIWQTSPHGNWSGWESLAGTIAGNNIAVTKNVFHGLEAFVKWNNNQLYHIWQSKQHGNWSGWESLEFVRSGFNSTFRGNATITINDLRFHGAIVQPVTLSFMFTEDRSGVRLNEFAPISMSVDTSLGKDTMTIKPLPLTDNGHFDKTSGSMELPLGFSIDHSIFIFGHSDFFGTVRTSQGLPLDRATGKIALGGKSPLRGGGLEGVQCDVRLEGYLSPLP